MISKSILSRLKKKLRGKNQNDKPISQKIYFNEWLLIVLLLTLLCHVFDLFGLFSSISLFSHISLYLLITVSILGIIPVLWSVYKAAIQKTITIDLLAGIALIFTIFDGQWVSAVFINLMLTSSRLFSAFTERRTQNIISHLLKLRPDTVKVQVGEEEIEKNLEQVMVGDIIVVESGDRIPVDGVVVKGEASVDESSLTGESEPASKIVGSKVFSATLCNSGSFFVRAEKVGENTTLSKMIRLVDEASREKTKVEALANKFSSWYIFVTLVGVAVIYIFTHNLNLILTVLLVTCADDLAVAIPLGFTVAISKAAKHGIIIKGAAVMERLKDIKIFVTDKTGTLTKGLFAVNKIIAVSHYSESEILNAGIFCSVDSKHPTSRAIIEYAKSKKVVIHSPDEVEEYPGKGVYARHGDNHYIQGKENFLAEKGVDISRDIDEKIKEEESAGWSVTLIALNKKVIGIFVLADAIRPHAKNVIKETRQLGVKKWIMLSGDNSYVAERVSQEVCLDEFHGDLKPEDKIAFIKKLKDKGEAIAMMGDGVNDAAALALADVSFAMGAIGSDSAIEAADIALMRDDLRCVPEAIFLSHESIGIVKQNFLIWGLTNGVGLILAFTSIFNPVGASVFNFLTDFLPILNVFKIYRFKINSHTYDKKI